MPLFSSSLARIHSSALRCIRGIISLPASREIKTVFSLHSLSLPLAKNNIDTRAKAKREVGEDQPRSRTIRQEDRKDNMGERL